MSAVTDSVIKMPLKGLKVIEMAGLAPAPLCGKFLHDFGATVIVVHKTSTDLISPTSSINRGKKFIALNLKTEEGIKILRKLTSTADVLLEPFRKGVLEKLGLGPDVLLAENPKLIYARLSGYGQHGHLSSSAGHDINYLSLTGLLSYYGWRNKFPTPPSNFSEFAGGSMVCFSGILLAIIDRMKTGKGQVIDSNIVEGISYVGSWLTSMKNHYFAGERGENWLDGGSPYYDVYETKDGKFMAVGALEPQFYAQFIRHLGVSEEEAPQLGSYSENRSIFERRFREKTRAEWTEIFDLTDACVTPVLSLEEAAQHKHNVDRRSFVKYNDGSLMPARAPKLSRHSDSETEKSIPVEGEHSFEILTELGYGRKEIEKLCTEGVTKVCDDCKL